MNKDNFYSHVFIVCLYCCFVRLHCHSLLHSTFTQVFPDLHTLLRCKVIKIDIKLILKSLLQCEVLIPPGCSPIFRSLHSGSVLNPIGNDSKEEIFQFVADESWGQIGFLYLSYLYVLLQAIYKKYCRIKMIKIGPKQRASRSWIHANFSLQVFGRRDCIPI